MAFLFDTNALSEVFRRRPNQRYLKWLESLSPENQFTSSVVIAELYVVAHRMRGSDRWLSRIEDAILPVVEVIHFDVECARAYGQIQGGLMDRGQPIDSSDAQIAATALRYRLTLVTANLRHFERVAGLSLLTFQPGSSGGFTAPVGSR